MDSIAGKEGQDTHDVFDGPLRRFLEQHFRNVKSQATYARGITLGKETLSQLKPGCLQENFTLKDIHGTPEAVERAFSGLMGQLYGAIGLEIHEKSRTNCSHSYRPGEKGWGVLVTSTYDERTHRLIVTVMDFPF